jgi:hypothetical protein
MSQSRVVQTIFITPAEPPIGRELLYKVDYPRCIDRYIDFFGDGVQANRCREVWR